MSVIDVHGHAIARDFLVKLARDSAFGVEAVGSGFNIGSYRLDPLLFDLDAHLADLRARKVALQLISPPPRLVANATWAADRNFAEQLNRQTAALVRNADGRLAGLAVPPLTEPDTALAEITRALDEDGLAGVVLPTSVTGAPLEDAFESLFAECARRRCPVFLHPTTGVDRIGQARYSMLQLTAWPSETTLCAARMIFAGVLERHPTLNIILAHGGGSLPFLIGRLDLAFAATGYEANPECRAHIARPPSSYLRQFYFDTVVGNPTVLHMLIQMVGTDSVLFGSDFPFEIADPTGAQARAALRDSTETTCRAVFFDNAARMLAESGCEPVRTTAE